MPNISILSEFDDVNLITKITLSADNNVLSTYTYSKDTNEVTVASRLSNVSVPLSIFNKGISETGTWSRTSVSKFSPTKGDVKEYQLSFETTTSNILSYSYTCNLVELTGTYTISTSIVTINSHAEVKLPWENFNQLISFFSFISNYIVNTKTITLND